MNREIALFSKQELKLPCEDSRMLRLSLRLPDVLPLSLGSLKYATGLCAYLTRSHVYGLKKSKQNK